MNKKERSCDVDNIVEWRHIITLLFALIAMAGQAQEISKVEPTATDYIKQPNKQGYHVLALDLSKLEKDKYQQ